MMHFGNRAKYTAHNPAVPDLHAPSLPAVKNSASQPRLRRPPALSSHPRPFDPDELTRKLYGVIAEQQAHAERKRRARAAIEAEREARYAAQTRASAAAAAAAAAGAHHAHPSAAAADASPTSPSSLTSPTSTAPLQDRRPGAPVLKLQTGEPTAMTSSTTKAPAQAAAPAGKGRRESLRRLFGAAPTCDQETSPSYHHVPQVAASQFARTTRVESLSERTLVHEYSRRTLNGRPEDANATTDADVDVSYLNRIKILRRTQSLKEGGQRNAPSFVKRLDATDETDERLPQQKLTQENLCHLLKSQGTTEKSGKNMADVFQRIVASLEPAAAVERPSLSRGPPKSTSTSQASPTDTKPMPDHLETVASNLASIPPHEPRVDWTQSDESRNHHSDLEAAGQPPLRKTDSKWTLKSRLPSFGKSKGDKQAASPIDEKMREAALASPKSPLKLGFFSRFKR